MYIERTEIMVETGHESEFQALHAELRTLRRVQPGFIAGLSSRSLTEPNRFRGIVRWEDEGSANALRERSAWSAIVQALRAVSPITREREAYELVGEVVSGSGPYAATFDWTIDPGKQSEFEQSRLEFFQLCQQHNQGFGRNILYRDRSDPVHYYAILAYDSLENLDALGTHPAVQEWLRDHPFGLYTSVPPVPHRWIATAHD